MAITARISAINEMTPLLEEIASLMLEKESDIQRSLARNRLGARRTRGGEAMHIGRAAVFINLSIVTAPAWGSNIASAAHTSALHDPRRGGGTAGHCLPDKPPAPPTFSQTLLNSRARGAGDARDAFLLCDVCHTNAPSIDNDTMLRLSRTTREETDMAAFPTSVRADCPSRQGRPSGQFLNSAAALKP